MDVVRQMPPKTGETRRWFEEFALRMPFLTSSRKGRGEDERQKLVQMKVAMASQKYAREPGSKQRMPMAPINPFIASDAEEVKSRCNAYANGGTKDGISKH